MKRLGAIEAGGTKFVCAAGTGPDDFVSARFPTRTPAETTAEAIAWLREQGALQAIGIASFGPVDLNPDSPTWGHITATPKPEWSNFDLVGAIAKGLSLPVAIETDVNAALLAEARWGAAQGAWSSIYLTVGTGIGGGALSGGRLVHGLTHPEMGHMRIPHDRVLDPFPGCCPFHGDCLEGLAAGPAIAARWGARAEELPLDHEAWQLEADYLAGGLASLTCILSPSRIVMGGGVMRRGNLYPLIETRLRELLAGYLPMPRVLPPALGQDAGILGALLLAERGHFPRIG